MKRLQTYRETAPKGMESDQASCSIALRYVPKPCDGLKVHVELTEEEKKPLGCIHSVLTCPRLPHAYLWLVGNGGMGYNYNYYYYHSSIPY